ncbi:MAG TPA: porin family protein, partial [Puia sp.]|nr:porin family protein [Puia sp.]
MKKLLFVVIAGISFATANAQGQMQFGLKGGLNLSNINVSNGFDGYSYSSLANFNAGAFLKIPVVRFFSLQPELYYSGQGFKADDGSGGTYSEHVNYLNIPVLAKFTTRSGFYLETGPQVGVKLSAKDKENGLSQDVSSAYNSADFAWVFGAGFKIPMAPVGIDLRYNVGITNVANDSYYGNGYGQYGVRNGVFQLDLF